jgi:hypothetical protein
MGSVTNNTTRVRIGYRIYSLWRFAATTQITIMVWILLSELHCTDVSLRRLTDEDWLLLLPETNRRRLTSGPTHQRPRNPGYHCWLCIRRDLLSRILGMAQLYAGYDCKQVYNWRMVSSGMLRRVALVRTDVSEEPTHAAKKLFLRSVRQLLVAACIVPM